MKIFRISQENIDLPFGYMPNSNTSVSQMDRLINTTNGSNKQYIICIYQYASNYDYTFSVIAYNGRIAGNLRMQPKGLFYDLMSAQGFVSELISDKVYKGYRYTDDFPSREYLQRYIPGDYSAVESGIGGETFEDTPEVKRETRPEAKGETNEEIIDKPSLYPVDKVIEALRGMSHSPAMDYTNIEDFIHGHLSDSSVRDKILELPESFFNQIRMTPEDRQIVKEHFHPTSLPKPGVIKPKRKFVDLLSLQNKNWYKMAQTAQEDYYTEEVAKNPNTSPEILAKILSVGNDDYVSRYAARNPNCPPEALAEVLSRGKDDYVSRHVAYNPNCPPASLAEVISRGNDDVVSCWAANNPNCPPEALGNVLSRGKDDNVSCWAAKNSNCPPEVLGSVLSRGNDDDVSHWASKNPNCPPLAKIKWMQATGRIEKEDPSKHIIEYDSKEGKDEDLEKLERLIQ